MFNVLMTSTMKSEAKGPLPFATDFGVPVSAAATLADGGSADGARGVSTPADGTAACALSGVGTALAAPATATPARNFRRSTFTSRFWAIWISSGIRRNAALSWSTQYGMILFQ